MENKITIAIDGFSSCGKSTMAKDLARELGYIYVDTGAMYRCVTLFALRSGLFNGDGEVNVAGLEQAMNEGRVKVSFALNASTGRPDACLNGEVVETEIRSMEVSSRVSKVAALPFVRKAMVEQQQSMGKDKGIVMDGRDIGTVVFPDAEMKIYVDASAETRARRRFDELRAKGNTSVTFEEVLRNVQERDHIDQTRAESPLRKADDALVLDNSHMTIAEQDAWLLDTFRRITAQ